MDIKDLFTGNGDEIRVPKPLITGEDMNKINLGMDRLIKAVQMFLPTADLSIVTCSGDEINFSVWGMGRDIKEAHFKELESHINLERLKDNQNSRGIHAFQTYKVLI